MKKGKFIKIKAITLVGCMLLTSVPIYAVNSSQYECMNVVGTDIEFDYDRYIDINSELDTVMSQIRKFYSDNEEKVAVVSTDSLNEYDELLEERDLLLSELNSMGADLDLETLSKFPAPTSTQARSSLTGNLADLAEYYENWFKFTGYEQDVTYNGKTYTACVVTVRDIAGNSGLLTSTYDEVELISKSKSMSADVFSEIADTGFGIYADELSGILDLGRIKSWFVSTVFSSIIKMIDAGTIIIQNNAMYYNYKVGLETNLYFAYIWDDSADEWVYCASSGKVYVDEEHTLSYYEYVGGSGSQYEWSDSDVSKSYSLTTVTQNELCSIAAKLYSDSGDSSPYNKDCYQISELEVKRQWAGSGSYRRLGNDFVFNPVYCDSPGDLWTLGTLN